jgi:hypothetical protein
MTTLAGFVPSLICDLLQSYVCCCGLCKQVGNIYGVGLAGHFAGLREICPDSLQCASLYTAVSLQILFFHVALKHALGHAKSVLSTVFFNCSIYC